MDLKRITSSFIVGLILIVLLVIQNNLIIGILFAIISLVAMDEYLKAVSKVCKPIKWVGYLSCAMVAIITFVPAIYVLFVLMFFIPTILLILFLQIIVTDMKTTFKDMAYTFLGICYIPLFIMFLTLINGVYNGKALLLYIFAIAWGTDVFAYCIGHRFGKHFFSKISTKKTIEGCIAGTLGAMVIVLIYTYILNNFFYFNYSYLLMGLIAIVLSLIGQIGDFSASCIKRYVDIKDYSNLLPGHGGMLDRIDSVLFIAPFAYLIFTVF